MIAPVLLFLLGFLLLIKGGDWFVDGSVGIAHRFHLPELLIGATVVSIGTTLPEVMVSTQAAFQGNAGISYGNAIGSVICNTSLIAALTVAIKPGSVNRASLKLPALYFAVAALIYSLIAWTTGTFRRWQGLVFLAIFLLYMVRTVLHMKSHPEDAEEAGIEGEEAAKDLPLWQELVMMVVGAAAIAVGANLLVNNGTIIAGMLGVPDSVIGLTMIALGTSLPELVTAITSLAKGHGALSLGNVIGANLFNIVLVSGMAIAISPFAVPAEKTIAGMNASLIIDIPVMLGVMALLCVPALIRGKLSRWQGILLLCIYAAFTAFQFSL
jgi:cation:H+ antiporter